MSSTASVSSSNKKIHHRRKRRRRTARSKSHKRSSSVKLSCDTTGEPITSVTATTSEIQSVSDNDVVVGEDDDDDDDESVDALGNQLADLNCQDEQQCDDSDSLDEAIDAEHLTDDNGNNLI